MTETEIKRAFVSDNNNLKNLAELLVLPDLRLYAFEFPFKRNPKEPATFVDHIFEIIGSKEIIVVEWKKGKVLHSALDQLLSYKDVYKQIWRPVPKHLALFAEDFSEYEAQACYDAGAYPVQYDDKFNLRLYPRK